MGVPTFYRWLCSRYPRVVKDVTDTLNQNDIDLSDIEMIGLDLLSPNPNGEFDNLYLDMNGIIHPCCHPENMEQPESEEIMFQCIFDYVDRIFYLVRPRKLVFLAIDGVAPRAKMNQQRSRRFKSAAEADLEEEAYEKVAKEFEGKNLIIPPRKEKWDSNVITPGTPFMHTLSKRIVTYIEDRINKYDAWQRISVIFSDGNVPGEGEHKIMSFIRNQRHSKTYNPNTRHVLHGMDADLIMLGLATHEVNFFIIREIVTDYVFKDDTKKAVSDVKKSLKVGEKGLKKNGSHALIMRQSWRPLQFLQLNVLREYLSHQLYFPNGWRDSNNRKIDFERCIDDLVLMCFFCGNDFLPNLPSFSISGGSIDQMILLYQQLLPELGDYLSNEGELNMSQLEHFVSYMAKIEDQVLRKEQEFRERCNRRMQQKQRTEAEDDNDPREDTEVRFKRRHAEILKLEREIEDPKVPIDLSLSDPKLWKAAYYREKFNLSENDDVVEFAETLSRNYVQGMCWVLKYYYQGCASWSWFYPFHYAPFCSDLKFNGLEFKFDLGKPFTPFQQLMSVMPARSSHCLPTKFKKLMTDPNSPLVDFYPLKFKEDPNGKRYKYQWVALLPFIDERKLLSVTAPLEETLSEVEKDRNAVSVDYLFLGNTEELNSFLGYTEKQGSHYRFVSESAEKHRSCLLKGVILPPKELRTEDLLEESRSRGFNSDVAKRMIINALGSSRSEKGSNVLGNFNRDFHQQHNRFSPQHIGSGHSAYPMHPHFSVYSQRNDNYMNNSQYENYRHDVKSYPRMDHEYISGYKIERPPWLKSTVAPPSSKMRRTLQERNPDSDANERRSRIT